MEAEISKLYKANGYNKPHKFIALLTALELLKSDGFFSGIVHFDENFKNHFSMLFEKYARPNDRNRPYTPFFHLKCLSFWKLVPQKGKENQLENKGSIGGPCELSDLVSHAELSKQFVEHLKINDNYKRLKDLLLSILDKIRSEKMNNSPTIERIDMSSTSELVSNNVFVGYLNSLQRVGGSNENALAESQACNPQFSHICIEHPLARIIFEEMQNKEGAHVILTGHAGDGKTTVAIDVLKRLQGLPLDKPLARPLDVREDLNNHQVTVIKDLSERNQNDDSTLVSELIERRRRFLIISNTGTLLSLLKSHHTSFNSSEDQVESDVLTAISADNGEATLSLGQTAFKVFNLARLDNLYLARKIFYKMLAPERWQYCSDKPCATTCPIMQNVKILQKYRDRIADRIFMAYRRMYEYGVRLTMRQLTEHLAYMITSGLNESMLADMRLRQARPLKTEFLFFNRFFGDNGVNDDLAAQKMKSVYEIQKQGFGQRPCPTWERKLWLQSHGQNFALNVPEVQLEFEALRLHGARSGLNADPGLTSDQAREQVRRMLYFLYDFKSNEDAYLLQYLNSPNILRWLHWQGSGAQMTLADKTIFVQRVFHVLQEHFTGVRLPEGANQHDKRLYITLNRRRSEIRQSAQVVLAHLDWSDSIEMALEQQDCATGDQRTDLVLRGKKTIANLRLPLALPFLDYVIMRHFGELGEVLQTAYLDRLERFKAQVLSCAKDTSDRIMLVRLRTDNTFRRQQFMVRNNRLEVNDEL